jgi:nitroreductase
LGNTTAFIRETLGGREMLKDIVKGARSYRRFYGEKPVSKEQLLKLIDLARLSPSGANKQPLKYIVINDNSTNTLIFDNIFWAGYLKDWTGPSLEERPTAYIIMLRDKDISKAPSMDEGIAAQSIFLGAREAGLGGCFIGSFKKDELIKGLNIDEKYEIALVIALGFPKEEVVIEELNESGDVKYWRDEEKVHHVPKRTLEDIIITRF